MINVTDCCHLLCKYHDCFDYAEFGDQGNACYKPYRDDEQAVVNRLIGNVRTAMPKGSELHVDLAKKVAIDLGLNYVQYDWLCKATARIIAGIESVDEIVQLGEMSRLIKERMRLA